MKTQVSQNAQRDAKPTKDVPKKDIDTRWRFAVTDLFRGNPD